MLGERFIGAPAYFSLFYPSEQMEWFGLVQVSGFLKSIIWNLRGGRAAAAPPALEPGSGYSRNGYLLPYSLTALLTYVLPYSLTYSFLYCLTP